MAPGHELMRYRPDAVAAAIAELAAVGTVGGGASERYHVTHVGPDILIVLVVVLVIVVIARGPKMLPRIGEALGRTVKTAREGSRAP